jgi:hypothetical protein
MQPHPWPVPTIVMDGQPRRKVLCLGVSYPSIEGQLRAKGLTDEVPASNNSTRLAQNVDIVYDKVRDRVLTVMDGRDLARCLQTEQSCNVDVYSVSQEKASVYRDDRHLDGNFNRARFVRSLREKFQCQFDEIILDYFWIPPAWDASHWKRSFFQTTLVEFVKQNVLRQPLKNGPTCTGTAEGDEEESGREGTTSRSGGGVVYLPFCFHCFKETYASFPILRKHYNLSFVRKHELHKISWWKGTQALDPVKAQQILGKRLDQEEIYCTFGLQHVNGSSESSGVTNPDLLRILYGLEDFFDIRFLALEVLAVGETGTILGLHDPSTIQRGFTRSPSSSTPPKPGTCAKKAVSRGPIHIGTPSRKRKRVRSPDCVTAVDENKAYRLSSAAKRQLF